MSAQVLTLKFEGDVSDLDKKFQNVTNKVEKLGDVSRSSGLKGIGALTDKLGEFDSIAGTALGNATSRVTSLVSSFGTLGVVAGAAAASLAIIGGAGYFAKIGEDLAKAEKQFQNLAAQAGISGEALKAGLEDVAAGLTDTDDLIEVANKAIVKLGAGAAQLPQFFELAQKSVKVFGGTAEGNLEAITDSIGNLNERGLKQFGIFVNAEKAYKDYAATLGVTAAQLTETEKRQAFLNASLAAGQERFKGISTGVTDNTIDNGLKRISLGFDDLKDSIAAIANGALGSALAATLSGIGSALSGVAGLFKDVLGGPTTINEKITELNKEIAQYQSLAASVADPSVKQAYLDQAAAIDKKIMALREQRDLQNMTQFQAATKVEERAIDPKFLAEKEAEQKKIVELEMSTQATLEAIRIQNETAEQERQLIAQGKEDEAIQLRTQRRIDEINAAADVEAQKTAQLQSGEEARAKIAEINAKRALDLSKEINAKKLTEAQKAAAQEAQIERDKLTVQQNTLNAGLSLFAEQTAAGKAIRIAQAIQNTYAGANLALATFPGPLGLAQAAIVTAAGIANVAKITAANTGALVTGGTRGVDSEPFLLSKGEIVAPAKSYDNVIEGEIRARGYVKAGGADDKMLQALEEIAGKLSQPSINIHTDFVTDDNAINRLVDKIRDAVMYRDAQLGGA